MTNKPTTPSKDYDQQWQEAYKAWRTARMYARTVDDRMRQADLAGIIYFIREEDLEAMDEANKAWARLLDVATRKPGLSKAQKELLTAAVEKTVKQYGETLRKLAKT